MANQLPRRVVKESQRLIAEPVAGISGKQIFMFCAHVKNGALDFLPTSSSYPFQPHHMPITYDILQCQWRDHPTLHMNVVSSN